MFNTILILRKFGKSKKVKNTYHLIFALKFLKDVTKMQATCYKKTGRLTAPSIFT